VKHSDGIFITGIGLISPLGRGRHPTLEALKNSICGIRPLTLFNTAEDQRMPAGEIDSATCLAADVPRTHALALLAAHDALEGKHEPIDAIVVGVTTGGMPTSESLIGHKEKTPGKYAYHGAGTVATYLAKNLMCSGPALTISTACSSGTAALKIAIELIRHGMARRVLAGGADALCQFTYYGFFSLQLIDPHGSRPLDKNRAGMSLGEGAAMMLIEGSSHPPTGAIARILGVGLSCDAYHPTAPNPQGEGALKAMRDTVIDAGISPSDINYVNLHGTGTIDNDAAEAAALRAFFGEKIPPASSTKGMTGHCLGAAGAIEAAICSLCVSEGVIPGNIGCTNLDPALGIPAVLRPERRPIRIALSNSFGFGGNNAAVVLASLDVQPAPHPPSLPRALTIVGAACLTGSGGTEVSLQKFLKGEPLAGTFPENDITRDLPARQIRRLKRLSKISLSLAVAAGKDAGPDFIPASIFFGTGWGPLSETYDFLTKLYESDMRFSSPTDFIGSVHNAPAGQLAMWFKATGANITTTCEDCSFEHALLMASLVASEGERVLILGADEAHAVMSPLLDPSAAVDRVLSDGGGGFMVVAKANAQGPLLAPLVCRSAQAGTDTGLALQEVVNGVPDINRRFGALFAGIPLMYETVAREQLNSFLSFSGFQGSVVDYRRYTGQYAAASAAAAVLALRVAQAGKVPAPLAGGSDVPLDGKGILLMGFGQSITAVEIRAGA